jgi:hypothetical protein
MRRIYLIPLLLLVLNILPAEATSRSKSAPPVNATVTEQEVLRDFEKILDLWRDGKYNDLFERTGTGRESREHFAKKLESAPRKPACCWEKMQEARVSVKSEREAMVRARLGFEGSIPGTDYVTKAIKMKKEDGVWLISQSDLFNLAAVTKKRAKYKYLPIQAK